MNGARGGEPIPPARGIPRAPPLPTHAPRATAAKSTTYTSRIAPRSPVVPGKTPPVTFGRDRSACSTVSGASSRFRHPRASGSPTHRISAVANPVVVVPAHRREHPTRTHDMPAEVVRSSDTTSRPLAAVVYACLYLVVGEGSLSHVFLSVR